MFETLKRTLFADPELLYKEERDLINKPFYFPGTNGRGVLLIHGWTSTPYEVRRLGTYLNAHGYTVYGPQLKGHGTVPKDLEKVKWEDWEGDVVNAYKKLKADCQKVYVGGTSIGANLVAILAAKYPVDGLILMAMPYRVKFQTFFYYFAKVFSVFRGYNRKHYPPTFGVSTTITRLISYQSYPIVNAFEVAQGLSFSRQVLEKIEAPCFIIQSTHDHIVERDSLEKIYKTIHSSVKRKKYIEQAYHTFISDIKNEHVFQDIAEFLDGLK